MSINMNCPWCGSELVDICTLELPDNDDRLISNAVREKGERVEEYEKAQSMEMTSISPKIKLVACHKCNEVLAMYGIKGKYFDEIGSLSDEVAAAVKAVKLKGS